MFREKHVSTSEKLFELVHHGDEFYPVTHIQPGHTASSKLNVWRKNVVTIVEFPEYPLRQLFKDTYGPYSVEKFVDIILSFSTTIRSITSNTRRMFMRKVWLMKQSHEIIENSLAMVVKTSKLLVTVYSSSVEVIDTIEARERCADKRMSKYMDITLETVRRVHRKIIKIIAKDTKFIKLLSPELLVRFVKDAEPWMISKIQCLPWIEPNVVALASPGYNLHWSEFWFSLFNRHFKISSELCRMIADYMPMPLKGETFLEFFRRKFDPKTNTYSGKRVFDVNVRHDPRKNHFVVNNHWCDYDILFLN